MTSSRYVQLDGLRAIAVFSVFMTHWLPVGTMLGFSPGRIGVNLFFVISGFLITGILLNAKDSIKQGTQSLAQAAGHFYARRALRLLPLVYMVLLITSVLDYPGVRDTVFYHIFYVGNYYFASYGDWYKSTTHLWSLAVEEQFYVMWPWVILLVPNRVLRMTIITTIISGPLFRLICFGLDMPSVSIRVLTPSSFDMFGVGALLAFIANRASYENVAKMKMVKWMGIIGMPLLVLSTAPTNYRAPILDEVGQALGSALFFGWLVIRSTVGFSGLLGFILGCKPMVYAGTISYCLYVVHNFVPYTIEELVGTQVWNELSTLSRFGISFACTFIIASISWRFFESPINRLKKYFSYS